MSMAYAIESRQKINAQWTKWSACSFNPNLDYARRDLIDIFNTKKLNDCRDDMEGAWGEMVNLAQDVEVGQVIECDDRQWRIVMV